MDYNKVEDAVLKKAMDFFKDNAVKFFGIDTKIISAAETEIKNIEIKTNYTDYLFYAEDGSYLHFEFQTTNKKDDIKRFLYYDASLYYKEKRKVRTIVIYSADIENVETQIDAGTIKYNIEAFYMKNINGDEKLEYLRNKIMKGDTLTGHDILTLTLVPLMGGKKSRSKRTLESIELADKMPESSEKLQCLTLLYALFDKFGDEMSKRKFREVVSMTEIGRMIMEEGIEKGMEKGKTEGKAEILIKQLIKKFKSVPNEYIEKIKKLSEEKIEVMATDIFDMESIEDVEKYL
jgi:predicted transposase/invertase (TIGR01784 family)